MKDCYVCDGRGYKRKMLFVKNTCKRCNGMGKLDGYKIIGVTLGWDAKPHICHEDGSYFPTSYERLKYHDYFTDGDWPCDPVTKEKLPIAPV